MPIGEYLKKMRSEDSEDTEEESNDDKPDEEKGDHPRFFELTEDELKGFKGVQPGQDLACEVHGTLEGTKFRVMSVSPTHGAKDMDEAGMSGLVAQRVQPTLQISPS
jgi:hypothetical protein